MTDNDKKELIERMKKKCYDIRGDSTHDEIIFNRVINVCILEIEKFYKEKNNFKT